MKSPENKNIYSVLYVEDDPAQFARTAKMLSKLGFFLYVAENGQEALRIYYEVKPDIVISDLEASVVSGIELAREIRKSDAGTRIILTVARNHADLLFNSFDVEVSGFLAKPVEFEPLSGMLSQCVRRIDLDRADKSLNERNSLLMTAIDRCPNMITIADAKGNIQHMNSCASAIRGINPADASGSHISGFMGNASSVILDALSKGVEWAGELSVKDKNGVNLVEQTVITPVRGKSGELLNFIVYSEDITGRKSAEEEIRKLNAELEYRVLQRTALLEATNKELDEFCDAISHELCGPLSRLQGLSKALCEDLQDILDETGKEYLNRINLTTIQLKQIIDALLGLSQLTRRGLSVQDVNLGSMASSIAQGLAAAEPDREVKFYITPDVVVRGDQMLLKVAMENLLSYAWKSTANHSPAQIEFGIARSKGKAVYFVRDNGCGFDMKYYNKLFKLFNRVQGSHDAVPSGVGTELAAAQRIIQRHGGRMWAEGELEKGATFYFTL